jgi:hypothetical protein
LNRQKLFDKSESFFLVILALGGVVWLVRYAVWVVKPFQLNFGEGPLLGVAARVARGLTCYPDPHALPYMINPYGPVSYYLIAPLVRLFGLNFTPLRIFVGAAAVCCAAFIGLLLRHWTGSARTGLAFGGVFLLMPAVLQYVIFFRVDFIGLAFTLAGFYLFVSSKNWLLSVPLFLAAFFCKFTFFPAPLACFIYMLLQKEWRKAFKFAASIGVLAAVLFLAFQKWTGGWFAFDTVAAGAVHPFKIMDWVNWTEEELGYALVSFVLTVALLFRRCSRGILTLPFIYLLITSLATVLRGKMGADVNYYLEWEAALCLCLGFEYWLLKTEPPDLAPARAFVPFCLGCSIVAMMIWITTDDDASVRARVAGCKDAYQFVRQHREKPILSENVGAMVLAGAPTIVFEPFLWTREVVGAGWSGSEILEQIRSRRIPLILLDRPVEQVKTDPDQTRWPWSVAEAIEQKYTLTREFKCADADFVYEPRATLKP